MLPALTLSHLLVGTDALSLKGGGVPCALCVSSALHGVQIQAKKNTQKKEQSPGQQVRDDPGYLWDSMILGCLEGGEVVTNPMSPCTDSDSGVG